MPTEIEISRIKVANRVRKHLDGIAGLAESIKEVGLLHPVVINKRRELIAGGRRLEAVKSLGWLTVPIRVIDTLNDALLALKAEHDENTHRMALKPSEMVEMGRRLEELEKPKAEERKGQRTDLEPSGNFPPSSDGGKTRDIVGEALGVSGKTYEAAKTIAEHGSEALKEAVDAGEVSISAGAEVAKLPEDKQEEIVAKGPEAVKKAAKASRQAKQKSKPEPVNQPAAAESASDTPVQQELSKEIEAVCRELDKLKATVETWKERPESYSIHFPTVADGLFRIRQDLWAMRLSHPCPYCETNAKPDCKACRGTRKVTKASHTQGARSMNRYGGVA